MQRQSTLSRVNAGSSDSSTRPLCDFLYPAASVSGSIRAIQGFSPRTRLRRAFLPDHTTARHGLGPLRLASLSSPIRHASTATAAIKPADVHSDQHVPQSSFPSHSLALPAHSPWQDGSHAAAPFAAPSNGSNALPRHWTSPWQGRKSATLEDRQLDHRFDKVIGELRAEFAEGWQQREAAGGLKRRRRAAQRLWHMYQELAHKEALSLATRVRIASFLAITVHLFSSNQTRTPTIMALRLLYGRRLQAISQDCRILLSQVQSSFSKTPPSILKHSNLGVALLEPLSVALQAKPIPALRLMDEGLLRCRPDIYRYQTDPRAESDYLSPIHTTLLTVMDSINFQINCATNQQALQKIISLKPKFFQDDRMLAGQDGSSLQSLETADPIKESLDWFIDSPHAFLLSHDAFKTARTTFLDCLSQTKDLQRLLDELQRDRDAEQPGFVSACSMLLRSALRKSSETALEFYDELWSRGVPVPSKLLHRMTNQSGGQAPSARLEALFHRITNPKAEGYGSVSVQLLRSITLCWAKRNRADRVTLLLASLKRRNMPDHGNLPPPSISSLPRRVAIYILCMIV